MDALHPVTVRLMPNAFNALERARKAELRSRSKQIALYIDAGLRRDGHLRAVSEEHASDANKN